MMDSIATTLSNTQDGAQAPSLPATADTPENAPRLNSGAASGLLFPHTVAEWQKNTRETIRVSLSEYHGRAIIDCRQWYSGNDGELKPSPKGLSLAVSHLPALADAIGKAMDLARKHGLVVGGEQ